MTKLDTFRGLEGLHLDVGDLARWATGTVYFYNANWKQTDLKMHSYLPPQFYWYKGWDEVSDQMIDAGMANNYRRNFGLTHKEIGLAETFFTARPPRRFAKEIAGREI